MPPVDDKQYRERVYEIVRLVPKGGVMTYGQIALILGEGYTPRTVGYVMHGSPEGVPWQRVINASGRISRRGDVLRPDLQRQLLELEGIRFRGEQVDLRRFRWPGPKRERRVATRVEL